jgi:hypothetical protein
VLGPLLPSLRPQIVRATSLADSLAQLA